MLENYIIKNQITDREDLEFLDSILNYVSEDKFSPKLLKDIINNCNYPKRYFQTFSFIDEVFEDDKKYESFIYEKAIDKLIKDNLIRKTTDNSYSLDYEGMMLIVNKGLLQKRIKAETKDFIQLWVWRTTLTAFIINLFFQIYNSFCKS